MQVFRSRTIPFNSLPMKEKKIRTVPFYSQQQIIRCAEKTSWILLPKTWAMLYAFPRTLSHTGSSLSVYWHSTQPYRDEGMSSWAQAAGPSGMLVTETVPSSVISSHTLAWPQRSLNQWHKINFQCDFCFLINQMIFSTFQ